MQDALPAPPPREMEDGVFKFNKFLIDTVYDFICLIYDKNDLSKHTIAECTARFYVLETVARVPYFAYLCASVALVPRPLCLPVPHLHSVSVVRSPTDRRVSPCHTSTRCP